MARRGLDAAQVVAAAAAVADAEGPDGVTLTRVAAALGVRSPSLYNHVAGREELLRGIGLLATHELTDRMRRATVGRAGADALAALMTAYRDYVMAHSGRWAVATTAFSSGDAEYAAAGRDLAEVALAVMRGWGLDGEDAIHAVRVVRSAAQGFVTLEACGGFTLDPDVDASFARLVAMLVAALDAQVPAA